MIDWTICRSNNILISIILPFSRESGTLATKIKDLNQKPKATGARLITAFTDRKKSRVALHRHPGNLEKSSNRENRLNVNLNAYNIHEHAGLMIVLEVYFFFVSFGS